MPKGTTRLWDPTTVRYYRPVRDGALRCWGMRWDKSWGGVIAMVAETGEITAIGSVLRLREGASTSNRCATTATNPTATSSL
jgi:hypothetical protein